jgi:hypothetical protein
MVTGSWKLDRKRCLTFMLRGYFPSERKLRSVSPVTGHHWTISSGDHVFMDALIEKMIEHTGLATIISTNNYSY